MNKLKQTVSRLFYESFHSLKLTEPSDTFSAVDKNTSIDGRGVFPGQASADVAHGTGPWEGECFWAPWWNWSLETGCLLEAGVFRTSTIFT